MRIAMVTVVGLLSACSTSPMNMQAAYVSPTAYSNLNCSQIDTEILAVDTRATDLYRRLKRRASYDAQRMAVGVLVAWPLLLFLSGGDGPQAAEYSQLKGQKDALIAARRSCSEVGGYAPRKTDIPGTVRMGRITLVPAATPSGICIIAPANYVGTGSQSSPVITTALPRCSDIQGRNSR